jgi:uncharacterized protein YjbJ (UPF0337 family)
MTAQRPTRACVFSAGTPFALLKLVRNFSRRSKMADRDDIRREGVENEIEGTGKDLKGRVKDAAGGLTGDTSLQTEGKIDRVKGKVQKKVGEVQNDVADRTDEDR